MGKLMHVISRKPFSDAARLYANDADALDRTIVPHAEYDKLCRRYRKEAE
jgi:mRNA-degrading endonuclease HigB of HigAB toxin-antitoxin module